MAFTTDFPGSSLPAEWTFSSTLADGSVTVSDSRAVINCPNTATHDTVFSTSSPDNSVGIIANVPSHSGDLDVAVQFDTDVSDQKGLGLCLLAFGATTASAARMSWLKTTANGPDPLLFGYTRHSGSGAAFFNGTSSAFGTGIASWLRMKYVSSTGLWTMMHSTDGYNWSTVSTATRSFTPLTFKISVSSTSGQATKLVRVNKVVDLIALGGTDARDAVPEYTRTTVGSIVGTEGSLPANFSNASSGTSTLTFTGSALRFNHDATQDNTPVSGGKFRSALKWTGTKYADCGMVFKVVQSGAGNSSCFIAAGLGYADVGGVPWDQYIEAGGYGLEVQSATIRRPLRIDNPFDRNLTMSSFPSGLDESPYTFLADTTGVDIRSSGARWFRIEKAGRRVRMREWADGASEPSTWSLVDAQDQTEDQNNLGLYISLSHNSVKTGTCVFDFTNLSFYSLTEVTGPTIKLGSSTKPIKLGSSTVSIAIGS